MQIKMLKQRPYCHIQTVLALLSLFWAFWANQSFWAGIFSERSFSDLSTYGFGLAILGLLFSLHWMLLIVVEILLPYRLLKPMLAVLIMASASASYFIDSFGVLIDSTMLRNVLHTDHAEAKELMTAAFWGHLALFGLLPCLALFWIRLKFTSARFDFKNLHSIWHYALHVIRGLTKRVLWCFVALAMFLACLFLVYQSFSSLMRQQPGLRHKINPASSVWALSQFLFSSTQSDVKKPIGLDAKLGGYWLNQSSGKPTKPVVIVMVVGETARAQNWQLNGYQRETTPNLAKLPVINFKNVTSCGTNTEVSVPCMFAPVGRRNYDENQIRSHQSLFNLLAQAAVQVLWRDNQSGCKGVCQGLPYERVVDLKLPDICDAERCLDEGLLHNIPAKLAQASGANVIVLHQLGNHGPSYFRRYPPEFEVFKPACHSDDLKQCSREEIVNAYDNALRYTDHVLAKLIAILQANKQVDSAMLYVSDHGESLGENALYLHGLPYAFAPKEQTTVPMVWWFSESFQQRLGLNVNCLQKMTDQPSSHDVLFHSILGLLDVQTQLYEKALDVSHVCRTH